MAYLEKEQYQAMQKKIRETFPQYRFGFSWLDASGIQVSILSGPQELIKPGYGNDNKGYCNHINTTTCTESACFLKDRIDQICNEIAVSYDRNASDMGADYCDYSYYRYVEVGRYNRPYEVKQKKEKSNYSPIVAMLPYKKGE